METHASQRDDVAAFTARPKHARASCVPHPHHGSVQRPSDGGGPTTTMKTKSVRTTTRIPALAKVGLVHAASALRSVRRMSSRAWPPQPGGVAGRSTYCSGSNFERCAKTQKDAESQVSVGDASRAGDGQIAAQAGAGRRTQRRAAWRAAVGAAARRARGATRAFLKSFHAASQSGLPSPAAREETRQQRAAVAELGTTRQTRRACGQRRDPAPRKPRPPAACGGSTQRQPLQLRSVRRRAVSRRMSKATTLCCAAPGGRARAKQHAAQLRMHALTATHQCGPRKRRGGGGASARGTASAAWARARHALRRREALHRGAQDAMRLLLAPSRLAWAAEEGRELDEPRHAKADPPGTCRTACAPRAVSKPSRRYQVRVLLLLAPSARSVTAPRRRCA